MIFSSATIVLPSTPFTHPLAVMSLFNPTICLATQIHYPCHPLPLTYCNISVSPHPEPLLLVSLYAPLSTSEPDSFHITYALLFSLPAKSASLFHHHVILCLALPLVLPHTVSVSSNRQSFSPFHIDSRSP